VAAHATHIITFQGYNLTNTDYRLHTSLIKNLAPEMGRGVKVTYGVRLF
jgi:outer membrane receptor protein involved in Fe transport